MFSHQKWLQVFKTLKTKGLDLTWITFRWHDLRLQFESLGGRQESSFFLGVSIRTLRWAVQHPTCREINDSLITTKLTFSIPNEQNRVGIFNCIYALRGCCKKGEHHPWRHRAVSRDGTKTSQAKSGSDIRPRPDKLPLGLRGRTKDYSRPLVVSVTQFWFSGSDVTLTSYCSRPLPLKHTMTNDCWFSQPCSLSGVVQSKLIHILNES